MNYIYKEDNLITNNQPSLNSQAYTSYKETIKSVCQLLLTQISSYIPVTASCIVYYTPDTNERELVTQCLSDCAEKKLAMLENFQLQEWGNNSPLIGQVTKLTSLDNVNAYVYVCNQIKSHPQYLLLLTDQLTSTQENYVKQQGQLFDHYLDLWLVCDRQFQEIQLLKQAIYRTKHQLRNPLAVIGLCAENLYLHLQGNRFQEQAINIKETVSELNEHLQDLLDFEQSNLQLSHYNLRMVLSESIKGCQHLYEEKQVKIVYPQTDAFVFIDKWQIKQVFDNLLSNAIYFSPSCGTVVCDWVVFKDEVLVQIRDQGTGLSETDLQEAFTPFYSQRHGGLGLGLAIAKKIILQHEGRLWAQNLLEGGAQFSLILPKHQTMSSKQ